MPSSMARAPEGAITLRDIRTLFERLGLAESFHEQEPLLLWPQVAGSQISRLTRPLRVRQGVLYVEAANHAVAQQLSLLKDAYLSKLNALLGEPRLRDLRFRVGSAFSLRLRGEGGPQGPRRAWAWETGSRGESSSPSPDLDLVERERIRRLVDELDDPKLKGIFEAWIQASVRRDRERARRGGKRCTTCGVHHEEEGDVCYYCELERA